MFSTNLVHYPGGNINDCTQAENIIIQLYTICVVGDRAYDLNKIMEYILLKSTDAVIEIMGKNKIFTLIERFFKLKQFRRIATRYDKLSISFLSLIQLVATLILIPKFPSIV